MIESIFNKNKIKNMSHDNPTPNSNSKSRKLRSVRKRNRKEIPKILSEVDQDIVNDLQLAYGGKYVKLDENLIRQLKKAKRDQEVEDTRPPPKNPFEHTPGMTQLLRDGKPLTVEQLQEYSASHHDDEFGCKMAEIIGNIPLEFISLRRSAMQQDDWNYKYTLPVEPRIINQQYTGTCWLASALNSLRYDLIQHLNVDPSFEFSRGYLFFWDKIERCNLILESLWTLRDRDYDDQYVIHHIDSNTSHLSDGGFWQYFVNLANKYGLLPKTMYDDGLTSNFSEEMNSVLKKIINYSALKIFSESPNWTSEEFQEYKEEVMSQVYDIVVKFIGKPIPATQEFTWKYKTVDGQYKELKHVTAHKMYQMATPQGLETKFVFICDDRDPDRYYKHYFLEHSMNVVGAKPCHFINVPKHVLKKAMAKSIMLGKPFWIGADVGNDFDPEYKTWDSDRFDPNSVLGFEIKRDLKQEQLAHNTIPCHAMVCCGVDCENEDSDEPSYSKWRIENSWGFGDIEHEHDKGYYRMSDSFVDKYLHMAVLDLSCFEEDTCKKIIQTSLDPITIKPWDIFGTLALGRGCKHCKY